VYLCTAAIRNSHQSSHLAPDFQARWAETRGPDKVVLTVMTRTKTILRSPLPTVMRTPNDAALLFQRVAQHMPRRCAAGGTNWRPGKPSMGSHGRTRAATTS
jgi:hypothetical protein